ncbi:MAG: polymer-forming cytoskeletal protein [Caulobacteraceae bacterium]
MTSSSLSSTGMAPKPSTPKVASLIANDMTLEGSITAEGELQIDGTIRGDVRVGRLNIGESGMVEGAVYADSVELRGKVVGSITAKTVRLYGTCHVDGDITHEQLAMETGAFFQGRSLKFQRPPAGTSAPAPSPTASAPASSNSSDGPNGSRPPASSSTPLI